MQFAAVVLLQYTATTEFFSPCSEKAGNACFSCSPKETDSLPETLVKELGADIYSVVVVAEPFPPLFDFWFSSLFVGFVHYLGIIWL